MPGNLRDSSTSIRKHSLSIASLYGPVYGPYPYPHSLPALPMTLSLTSVMHPASSIAFIQDEAKIRRYHVIIAWIRSRIIRVKTVEWGQ